MQLQGLRSYFSALSLTVITRTVLKSNRLFEIDLELVCGLRFPDFRLLYFRRYLL